MKFSQKEPPVFALIPFCAFLYRAATDCQALYKRWVHHDGENRRQSLLVLLAASQGRQFLKGSGAGYAGLIPFIPSTVPNAKLVVRRKYSGITYHS